MLLVTPLPLRFLQPANPALALDQPVVQPLGRDLGLTHGENDRRAAGGPITGAKTFFRCHARGLVDQDDPLLSVLMSGVACVIIGLTPTQCEDDSIDLEYLF